MENISFHDAKSGPLKRCQITNKDDLELVIDLGHQPLCDTLLTKDQLNKPEKTYPLRLYRSKSLGHGQLDYVVPGEEVYYPDYPYRPGITKEVIDHHSKRANQAIKKHNIAENSLIVDIGSNDGTLLSNFKGKYKILGIEPTAVSKIANSKGIKTINKQFNYDHAKTIKKKYGKADLITATNVFAHIEDIHQVMKSIKLILKKDGVFISESHYLFDLISTLQYDTVYHEHLRYYSLRSLKKLFSLYNMEIFDITKIPTHGGSIRVYSSLKGKYKISKNVIKLLKKEQTGRKFEKKLLNFSRNISISKLKINSLIYKYKLMGKKIVGISSPSRSSTLINYLGLDHNIIDYICEINGSLKIGKNIPGTNIPVVDENILFKDQPDIAIVFSWHIYKELVKKIKKKGFKGKFMIPLPNPKII